MNVVVSDTTDAATVLADVDRTGLAAVVFEPLSERVTWRPSSITIATPAGRVTTVPIRHDTVPVLARAIQYAVVICHGFPSTLTLHDLGLRPASTFDTEIALRLLDAGRTDADVSFRLDAMLPPTARSATQRASALVSIAELLDRRIHDANLGTAFELECRLLPELAAMQRCGVPVDSGRLKVLVARQRARADTLRTISERQLGCSLAQPEQVLRAVRRGVGDVPDTKKATLLPYIADPVIAKLIEYRRLTAIADTSEAVLRAAVQSDDGRVRATFRSLGCATGRMTCTNPNLLALPKAPDFRECIAPSFGRGIVDADYAALELRVLADQIQEQRLIDLFRRGGDPHSATAGLLYAKAESAVTRAERSAAKAVNFGLAFGMGDHSLVDYARAFGVGLDLATAARFRGGFLSHYEGIASWHRAVKAQRAGVVRSASGRARYLARGADAFCARLNTPVQGTGADGIKNAVIIVGPRLRPLGASLILAVHDQLVVEGPREATREIMRVVIASMEEGMAAFVPSVPIVVEASANTTWRGQ